MRPSKFNRGFGVGEVYKEKSWKDLWVILMAVIPQNSSYWILKEPKEGESSMSVNENRGENREEEGGEAGDEGGEAGDEGGEEMFIE